eukprot:3333177-Amphidinium_carterae.1
MAAVGVPAEWAGTSLPTSKFCPRKRSFKAFTPQVQQSSCVVPAWLGQHFCEQKGLSCGAFTHKFTIHRLCNA